VPSVVVLFGGALIAGGAYQGLLGTRRGRRAMRVLTLGVTGLAVTAAISGHDIGYALLPLVFPVLVAAKAVESTEGVGWPSCCSARASSCSWWLLYSSRTRDPRAVAVIEKRQSRARWH